MKLSDQLNRVFLGNTPNIFNDLNEKSENQDLDVIKGLISKISILLEGDKHYPRVFGILSQLEDLDNYYKWIEHPIYLNEFKDKNGNIYLQARTSIKDQNGKTKWLNAYVGSKNEYPKGVNDPNALDKAKPLIRKKLKPYFGLK